MNVIDSWPRRSRTCCFVGRLASYKYFNMDQAILNALEMFDSLKESGKLQPKRRPEDFGPATGRSGAFAA